MFWVLIPLVFRLHDRSPAVVIAYLMKRKGWRLAESHQWVKQRRTTTDISPGKYLHFGLETYRSWNCCSLLFFLYTEFYQQLQEFEQSIFGSGMMSAMNINDAPTFGFGFPKIDNQAQAPVFNNAPTSSIFSSPASSIPPQEFTFGATPTKPTTGGDIAMDGS